MNFILWRPGTLTALLTVIVILFGLVARPIKAQVNYGNVRGRITDAQGAVVSGAEISLTNLGTKIVRSTLSNQSGDYFFTAVVPGDFTPAHCSSLLRTSNRTRKDLPGKRKLAGR